MQRGIFFGSKGPYGFWKVWKVMETDKAIFQDLVNFLKREVFQTDYRYLFGGILKYPEVDIT